MDLASVTQQLKETKTRLLEIENERARLEAERKVLINLVEGFTGWLELRGEKPPAFKDPEHQRIIARAQKPSQFAAKGTLSMKDGVFAVLQKAQGQPLHLGEILASAIDLGVVTAAANPVEVAEMAIGRLRKEHRIERTAPRTYRLVSA